MEAGNPPLKQEIKATESAIKLATEIGIDLSKIVGTGLNGRITAKDVEDAR
jgi:pyruvate/2-oxoglutarate dehydrogenase complex dihydrolipoamide acyltransferase (E2) component